MNSIWQHLTLTTLPLYQWRSVSYLQRPIGLLRHWRRGSRLMQWADLIGAGLISLVYALSPFLSNGLVGVLLIACALFWLLLTLSDDDAPEAAIVYDRAEGSLDQPTYSLMTPIHLLVLLYWGIASVATALSPVKKAAFTGWTKLTLYLILFALLARLLRSPRIRSWVLAVYLLAALIVSVYGLQQWFSGTAALATWVDPESPLSKTTRVYSYLGNPNLLAGYLVPAVVFSIAAIFAWRRWLPKALAMVMTMVNGACLILTFSRGGWIGMVVSVLLLMLLLAYWWSIYLPRFWRIWTLPLVVGSLAGLLILAVAFVEPLRDRISSIFAGRNDSSNNFRINVWMAVIEMIKDRPILGIGPGNVAFNKIYPIYQRPRFTALSAYSIPLEIAVETGIIGLTCFCWLLLVTVNLGWKNLQALRAVGDRSGFWLMAAIATLFGMLSHGLVDTVWYRPQVNTLWWLMFALIASYASTQSHTVTSQTSDFD